MSSRLGRERPFHRIDEVTAGPPPSPCPARTSGNAWIFTLNYTNYSEYFSGFPVPGIDFLYSPKRRFSPLSRISFDGVEVDLLAVDSF